MARGPSNEHFWQVRFNSVHWFQRRRFKCEKLTDGRTLTHDKSSHGLWPGELKKGNLKGLLYTFVCECVYVYVHISLFLPECACTTLIDISPRIFSLMYCCCVSIIIVICICLPGALIWLINLFLFLYYIFRISCTWGSQYWYQNLFQYCIPVL